MSFFGKVDKPFPYMYYIHFFGKRAYKLYIHMKRRGGLSQFEMITDVISERKVRKTKDRKKTDSSFFYPKEVDEGPLSDVLFC
jgi:hypothetical protein